MEVGYINMILVTLGTNDKRFDRLLKAIDKQIELGNIKDKVVVQAGCTSDYKSKNMEIFDLIPMGEFNRLISECDILITHGGVGSIITGLKNGKKVIAAARLEKYVEHVNDHQKQIIKRFVDKNYILELEDFDKLDKVLKEIKTKKFDEYKGDNSLMLKTLTDYIDNNKNHHIGLRLILGLLILIGIILLIVL